LSALKPTTRLIILGDSEQLASVDSGSLFGDLCTGLKSNENQFEANHLDFINAFLAEDRQLGEDYTLHQRTSILDEHLVRLKKTYRYDQGSKMGQFTKAVIHGRKEQLDEILAISEDSLVLDESYEEAVFNNFIKGYHAFIEEPVLIKALEKLNDCRVLCAVRQGDQGIYKINLRIESQLKSHYNNKAHNFQPTDGFYHNQPIMVTQNTPEINLFNGDVGIVRKDENGRLKAYFVNPKKETDGKELMTINPTAIPAWETVFAMTIHKSQGSEFNEVLVVLPKQQENRILTRELLYTGVTRAKEKAIIQSSLDLIKSTTEKSVNRVSGVQDRIKLSSTKK
jgi:exodeoxyribonuclease V alpha subunit